MTNPMPIHRLPFTAVITTLTLSFSHLAIAADLSSLDTHIQKQIKAHYDSTLALYKYIHKFPELSFQEKNTGIRLTTEMKALGFKVTSNFGGHGVVAIFKNGPGPTIMVRTDMDALPIIEQTGLDYASKVVVPDGKGGKTGVMHACGHDMHMALWVGTAKVLTSLKDKWSGTLMFIAQPAEERGAGARAMLKEGLFTKFKKPDYALALHVDSHLPIGSVGFTPGWAMANVDSVTITIKGKGGHGAAPHAAIDPVLIAARTVVNLQSIVSREVNPQDAAVVTVGSIHGGTKHNIIPDSVKLELTVRSYTDATRNHLLKAITRITKASAKAANAPEPSIQHDKVEYTPALYNDLKLVDTTVKVFRKLFDDKNVIKKPPVMGGEDFARYGKAGVPIFMFRVGTVDRKKFAKYIKRETSLPSVHSPLYYPIPKPTIETGLRAMSHAVLNLMKKK